MQKLNNLSRSPISLDPDGTLIAVIELSLSSWLVAGIVPGVERQPLKQLEADESALLKLLDRWREEAKKAGHWIERIAVAFEAGRDGFWLARWLRARDIEAHVIHASSVAVSREHWRAKTDRLDTELLKRSFLGWLRGERDHCKMVKVPDSKNWIHEIKHDGYRLIVQREGPRVRLFTRNGHDWSGRLPLITEAALRKLAGGRQLADELVARSKGSLTNHS